jgi:hypothetical protein
MSQLAIGKGTVQIILKDTTVTGYEAVVMHNYLSEYTSLLDQKNKLNPFASKQGKSLANKLQQQKEMASLVKRERERLTKTTDQRFKSQIMEKIQRHENTMEKIAEDMQAIRTEITENEEEAEKLQKQTEEFYKALPDLNKSIFDKEVLIVSTFLKAKNYEVDEIIKTASIGQMQKLLAGIIENEENGLKTDFFPLLPRLKGVKVEEDEAQSKEADNSLINL